MLLFDAILHLACGALECVVQPLGPAGDVGDDVARVGPFVSMLDSGDDRSRFAPGVRGVVELSEVAHFLGGDGEVHRGLVEPQCWLNGNPKFEWLFQPVYHPISIALMGQSNREVVADDA